MRQFTTRRRALFYTLYWLLFAVLCVQSAGDPGFVLDRERVPFPWIGLMFMWLSLGAAIFALALALRPGVQLVSWPRLAWVTGVFGILAVASMATNATDQPGLYYVPGLFFLATFVGLLVRVVARSLPRARRDL